MLFKNIRNSINWVFSKLAQYLIPDHIKRLMFLVSLYNHMTAETKSVEQRRLELAELNKAMKLAKTKDVRMFTIPTAFTESLWPDRRASAVLKCDQPEHNRRRVSKLIKCWLIYGREDDIKEDISKLKSFIEDHRSTA